MPLEYITFEGASFREALDQMYAFGAAKNILPMMSIVRRIEEEKKSFLGLKKNKTYKILVSVSDSALRARSTEKKQNDYPDLFNAPEPAPVSTQSRNERIRPVSRNKEDERTAELENEVNSLKSNISEIQSMIEDRFSELREHFVSSLVKQGIDSDKKVIHDAEQKKNNILWAENELRKRDFSDLLINDIIEYLNTQKAETLLDKARILVSIRDFLKRNLVTQEISIENYNHGNYILLAGPTGVGKTITTVKMAAHIAVMRQKTIRFISIDRYKVGADSQLKTYAEYMNAPFYPIHNEKEFFELIEKDETDFTFIDTAGKGPREGVHIKDLSDWIKRAGKKIDIHLVISCGTKGSDLDFYMKNYAPLGFDHILATKKDETVHVGSVLSLVYQSQKPLSFITTGQEVPQDIEIANIENLIADSLNKE